MVRQIAIEYLCESIPECIAHVELHETRQGFGSLQFVIGCCPLMAPSSFAFSSCDGMSADWGYQHAGGPNLVRTDAKTIDRGVKQVIERAVQVVTVYKKGSLIAACKGSYRTGKLRATQNKEDWCVWASRAAIEARGQRTVTGWIEG
jgi:hypothetical protein